MQMSEKILNCYWEQIRQDARGSWGKLTEADLEYIGGNFARFVYVLRQRYGHWRVKAEDELTAFLYRYPDVPANAHPVRLPATGVERSPGWNEQSRLGRRPAEGLLADGVQHQATRDKGALPF